MKFTQFFIFILNHHLGPSIVLAWLVTKAIHLTSGPLYQVHSSPGILFLFEVARLIKKNFLILL